MYNIYQLYYENGCKTPFKVKRITWGATFAIVKSIGGQTSGELMGEYPYFDTPVVIADVEGYWTEKNAKLPCPGTYQWEFVS